MDVGTEVIYRLRDESPSERVRIVDVDSTKKTLRYVVEFLDGERSGRRENVPRGRLRGPWSGVAEFDALMANWDRIERAGLSDIEQRAAEQTFLLLIPESVADLWSGRVHFTTHVYDAPSLEVIAGVPLSEITSQVEWFEADGELYLDADGTRMIAHYACQTHPEPILQWVYNDERECQRNAIHGGQRTPRANTHTSADWEYTSYVEHHRHTHELLRAWCGHRAVEEFDRLGAAEDEATRLGLLVRDMIQELERLGHKNLAASCTERLWDERVTAGNFRPAIERARHPEVRIQYVNRRRWW